MTRNNVQGAGSSGPLIACTELEDSEHDVLGAVTRANGRVDVSRISKRLDVDTSDVRDALVGLRDSGFMRGAEDEWILVARCACPRKRPGQKPFLERDLNGETPRTTVRVRGLSVRSSVREDDSSSPQGEEMGVYIDTHLPHIESIRGPRISKRSPPTSPNKTAWGFVRYFNKLTDAATGTRWKQIQREQQSWFIKELMRWLTRDATPAIVIKVMMQEFFRDVSAGVVKPKGDVELWRIFVARKTTYHRRAEQKLARKAEDEFEESDEDESIADQIRGNTLLPTQRDVDAREGRR